MTSDTKQSLIAAAFAILTIALSSAANGCSRLATSNDPEVSLEDFSSRNYDGAEYVADVRVITVTFDQTSYLRSILYDRINSYKGNLPERGAFTQEAYGCDHIIESFRRGDVAMVFLSKDLKSVYERNFAVMHTKRDVAEILRKKLAADKK